MQSSYDEKKVDLAINTSIPQYECKSKLPW